MKRAIIFCLILLTSIGFSETIKINENTFKVDVLESNNQQTTISYEFGSFERSEVLIDGKIYYRLLLPGGSITFEKGKPELPKITRSIIIPDDGKVNVEIVEQSYTDYYFPVAPSKGMILRSQDPDDIPYTFSDIYGENTTYPGKNAELGKPYILRNFRGITVTACPFQYNPQTQMLRVYHHLVLSVNTVGLGTVNVKSRISNGYNTYFEELYQGHFINFNRDRYDTIEEYGRMIVISYGPFMETVQPFVDWKNQKGVQCDLYDVADIGSNASSISAFIEGEYLSDNSLTFVQLVGDDAQVPAMFHSGGGSDVAYTFIEGNDVYPELFIGRFSAENTSQVQTQVERSVWYERDIVDGEWLHKGIGVASDQGAGQGDEGEPDDDHQDNIRQKLLDFTYTEVDQFYDSNGGTISACVAALNEGRGIVNYTGHGTNTAWGNGAPLSNSDVNGLTNDYMLPFINSVACVNGNFAGTTCFAEAWLRATNSSTGAPTGAIAMYASTINQSWAPPMRGQDHAIDLLVGWDYVNDIEIEQKNTIGGLWFNSSCNMVDVYGDDGMMATWTIFGDASLQVRTETPQNMNITHTGTLLIGATEYNVSTGVENALVSLSIDGSIIASGYTENTGNITLLIEEPQSIPGMALLTVSAFNKITSVENIQVIAPEGPYLMVSEYTPHTGDDDIIEFGEEVFVDITLTNIGVDPASNIVVSFSTNDFFITPSYCASDFYTLGPNESYTVDNACSFLVAENAPNDHSFIINAEINSDEDTWTQGLSFTSYSPVISVGDIVVYDGENGRLDPGETADLIVTLENVGGADLSNIIANLNYPLDDGIIIVNVGVAEISTLDAYSTVNVTYNVTVSDQATIGHTVLFSVEISGDNNYSTIDEFFLTIGLSLEDFETGDFTMYPWEFGGNADWMITETAHEGVYAAQSMDINDSQTSELSVTLEVLTAGDISFYYKVSSESSSYSFYDGLKFYIDGVEQGEGWQGEIDWSEASFPVTTGEHTFKWVYLKDGSVTDGEDCAWVDYIIFPPVSPPVQPDIAINPLELDLAVNSGSTVESEVVVANEGTDELGFSISESTPWLTVFPMSGLIAPYESQTLLVTADAGTLSEGTYSGAFVIESNDPDEAEVTVSVSLVVGSADVTVYTDHITGWNMVGLPVGTELNGAQDVYPSSVNNTLYSYTETGYTLETDLGIGTGYWLRFNESGLDTLIGEEVDEITIQMMEGWNMIAGGSLTNGGYVDINNIVVPNTLYGFGSAGYYNASSIEPGYGYWLRANAVGEIQVAGMDGMAKLVVTEPPYSNRITINGTTLYFGTDVPEEERLSYSLPPKPPVGAPDVRFRGDMKLSEEGGVIEVMNEGSMIEIEYALHNETDYGMRWVLTDPVSGEDYILEGEGRMMVPVSDTYLLKKEMIIPDEFALHQNYPNPFNPITTIMYDVPEESEVMLRIYDVTGRMVKELVNGEVEPGRYQVVWNGTDMYGSSVASGMYLYQLKTHTTIKTNKLILLK